MTARAGWFPDPAGRPDHFRWWDGSAWTRYLTTDRTAPEPGPDPEPVGRHRATEPTGWQRAGQVVAGHAATAGHAAPAAHAATSGAGRPPGYERPERARPNSLPMALVGSGAVVLVAVIVLAIVLFGNSATPTLQPPPPETNSAPAGTPTPTPPEPSTDAKKVPVSYDPTTRAIDYDGLQITLPATPYKITRTFSTILGTSGEGAEADAVVHKNYNGVSSDWDASVIVDGVGPDLTGKTLDQTADKIMTRWAKSAFNGAKTTVTNEKKSSLTKNLPRPARVITADIHYSIKGVPSKYDHVSLLVTPGKSGGYVAFISSRPNDSDAKIKKSLQDSINTVGIT